MDPSGEVEEESTWDKFLNGTQLVLDIVGLVPLVGEPADGVNALIYEARGDHLNAALSGVSMIPVAGWFGTGGKFVNKAIKHSDDASSLVKETSKASELWGRQMKAEYTASKIKKLKGDMLKNGFDSSKPIEIFETDGKKIIVDGHHRTRAAGAAKVDVVTKSITEKELFSNWNLTPDQLINQAIEAAADFGKSWFK